MAVGTKAAFHGTVRHLITRAESALGVILNTYAPGFDEAAVKLLSPEEKVIVQNLIISLQQKLAARFPVQ